MPNKRGKEKHTIHHSHHNHHGMYGPYEEQTEDNHDKLKGEPFPHTSKPTHTNDTKPPIRIKRRKG